MDIYRCSAPARTRGAYVACDKVIPADRAARALSRGHTPANCSEACRQRRNDRGKYEKTLTTIKEEHVATNQGRPWAGNRRTG